MILIAGPCVIESRDFILQMAEELREIASLPNIDFYFKSSFDKANRTSISSFRGPGLEKGCEITKERRPDLWEAFLQDEERLAGLSKQEKKIIEKVFNDRRQAWQKKI